MFYSQRIHYHTIIPCFRNKTCTCQKLDTDNPLEASRQNTKDSKCGSAPIEFESCRFTDDVMTAIADYASMTNDSFSDVLQKFLADTRIDINFTLPKVLKKCLDCSDKGCRNCRQRRKILARLLRCDESRASVPILRKNARKLKRLMYFVQFFKVILANPPPQVCFGGT